MGNVSRNMKAGRDQALLKGIDAHLSGLSQLPLGGKLYTPESLKAFIQQRTQASNAVAQARAAWLDAIRTYKELDAHADVVVRDLRNLAIGALGADSDDLQTFSFSKPKRVTFTAEQMKAIVQKRLETRKARRTMGRRQKAKIKGVVPPVAVEASAIAAPAAPVVATAPAAAPAPAPIAVPAAVMPSAIAASEVAPPIAAAPAAVIGTTAAASPAPQVALAGAKTPAPAPPLTSPMPSAPGAGANPGVTPDPNQGSGG
jgi:hypothetical protein